MASATRALPPPRFARRRLCRALSVHVHARWLGCARQWDRASACAECVGASGHVRRLVLRAGCLAHVASVMDVEMSFAPQAIRSLAPQAVRLLGGGWSGAHTSRRPTSHVTSAWFRGIYFVFSVRRGAGYRVVAHSAILSRMTRSPQRAGWVQPYGVRRLGPSVRKVY